jgi:hypothetical protein
MQGHKKSNRFELMTIAKKEIRIDMQSNPATQVAVLMQASQDVFVVGSYVAMIILKKISRLPRIIACDAGAEMWRAGC